MQMILIDFITLETSGKVAVSKHELVGVNSVAAGITSYYESQKASARAQ